MAETRPLLLLDGATGTELTRRGVDTHGPAWSAPAIVRAPDVLRAIHEENARAGADVITADTFRTQRRTLARIGQGRRAREWTLEAVRIAREAVQRAMAEGESGRVVRVAGSVAPLEDSYTPDLAPDEATALSEHREHAGNLADAGVDLLLVETMTTIAESRAATRAAAETGLQTWTSVTLGADGTRLISGEPLADWVEAMAPLRPAALLVNCVAPAAARTGLAILAPLAEELGALPGAYANLGSAEPLPRGGFDIAMTPDQYAEATRPVLAGGARIVGGCCGTTPEHIRALRTLLDERLAEEQAGTPEDAAWRELVERAAAMAGGGRALLIGDGSSASALSGYDVTVADASESALLPEAAFRLTALDAGRQLVEQATRALEPGGWLVARLRTGGQQGSDLASGRITVEGLELREFSVREGTALLLARRSG